MPREDRGGVLKGGGVSKGKGFGLTSEVVVEGLSLIVGYFFPVQPVKGKLLSWDGIWLI